MRLVDSSSTAKRQPVQNPPSASDISKDANWLVQALDANSALTRLVRMDREAYRAASFLDDRMLAEPRETAVMPWADVAAAVPPDARKDARWIFHIGHVGSTLVSRLLGELPNVLSVREPRILRDVSGIPAEQRQRFTGPLSPLFSRTFDPSELALVKATSFVSEIAPELVASGQRALFMYASPRNYIASILAGENSVKELTMLAASRAQRSGRRASLAQPNTAAELAGAAWACEMTALEAAADAMADRQVTWANFDAMLADMPMELGRVAAFFGFAASDGQLQAIVQGPLMGRYSKALEYDYTPSLRRDLIAQSDAANRPDIDRAIAMLHSAAETSPLLARALDRAKDD
jgi:hypothetical protein